MAHFTDKEVNNLVKMYTAAEQELTKEINRCLAKGNKTEYLISMRQNTQAILKDLDSGSRDWCEEAIPRVYTHGLKAADAQIREQGLTVKGGFGGIHEQAAKILSDSAYSRFGDANATIGRRVNDIYRTLALENIKASTLGYQSWKKVAKNYREALADKGVTGFVDKSGRSWNMKTYSEMVARTTTMEAHTQGTALRLQEQGFDLVRINDIGTKCPKCARWEGEILSLSGNDPDHESLDKAKTSGLFHPNCRHDFSLYRDVEAEIAALEKELGKPKPKVEPPVVAQPKKPLTLKERVAEVVASGDKTDEVTLRKIGAMIRAETFTAEELTALTKSHQDWMDMRGKIYMELQHPGISDARIKMLTKELGEAKKYSYIAADLNLNISNKYLDTLKTIRNFGGQFEVVSGRARSYIDKAAKYIPEAWINLSNADGAKIVTNLSRRGYCINYGNKLEISLTESLDEQGRISCSLHELSHRMENIKPSIVQAETSFYNRRTAGETLEWLGPPYRDNEMTRKDKFTKPYMGKYYGGNFYELLSMGIEGVFFNRHDLATDTDYIDFILGVLAVV